MKAFLLHKIQLIFSLSVFICIVHSLAPSHADQNKLIAQNYQAHEQLKKASEQFEKLYQRSKGTPQEHTILLKLIDTYQKVVALEQSLVKKPELSSSKKLVEVTSTYLNKFPTGPFVMGALTIRAKYFRNSGKTELAKKDFMSVIQSSKANAQQKTIALVYVADILMQDQKYSEAIPILHKLEATKEKEHYQNSCEQLSVAYGKINQFEKAIFYAEKSVLAVNSALVNSPKEDPEENSEVEAKPNARNETTNISKPELKSAVSNITMLYAKLLAQGNPKFTIQKATQYFSNIFTNYPIGEVFSEFAYQLRTSDQSHRVAELALYLSQGDTGLSSSAIYRVIEVYLDESYASKRYENTEKFLIKFYEVAVSLEPDLKFRTFLLSLADSYKKGRQSKGTERDKLFVSTIRNLYKLAIRISGKDQNINGKVYLNLAELSYEAGDFQLAETSYTKAYELLSQNKDKQSKAEQETELIKKALFSSIICRYELLKKSNQIPQKIVIQPLSNSTEKLSSEKEHPLLQWEIKINLYSDMFKIDSENEIDRLLSLKHEANRAIYQNIDVALGIDRFKQFVTDYPQSKHASPAAAIVIETLAKSNKTEEASILAQKWAENPKLAGSQMLQNLKNAQAEIIYKNISALFKDGKHKESLNLFLNALKNNPKLKLAPAFAELALVAAYSAMNLGNNQKAEEIFLMASKSESLSDTKKIQLYTGQAQLYEGTGNFVKAMDTYRKLLSIDQKSGSKNKSKLFILAIYTNPSLLEDYLADNTICPAFAYNNQNDPCNIYLSIIFSTSESNSHKILQRAKILYSKKEKITQPTIQVALGIRELKQYENIEYNKLNLQKIIKNQGNLYNKISATISKSDPLLQPLLLAELNEYLKKNSLKPLSQINKFFPLGLNPKLIEQRKQINLLFDQSQSQLSKWPMLHSKVTALKNIALSKIAMANALKSISIPVQYSKEEADETKKVLLSTAAPLLKEADGLLNQAMQVTEKNPISPKLYAEILNVRRGIEELNSKLSESKSGNSIDAIKLFSEIVISNQDKIQNIWIENLKKGNEKQLFLLGILNIQSANFLEANQVALAAGYTLIDLIPEANSLLENAYKKLNDGSVEKSAALLLLASNYNAVNNTKQLNALNLDSLSESKQFSPYLSYFNSDSNRTPATKGANENEE